MHRLTVSITEEQEELLDDVSGEGGEYESKSAAVRDFIQAGERERELRAELARAKERLSSREARIEDLEREHADRVEELQDRITSREERIEQLEEQLARRSQLEEKVENLPTQIQEQESYRERRRRKLDEASLAQRLKWKVTGVPVEQSGAGE
jgi:predicted  nucleic acid-binding Zn-ribbon protein